MDGENSISQKGFLKQKQKGMGSFLEMAKTVWCGCFQVLALWYESEERMGVGWGSGTGVWRFIKRLELGGGGEEDPAMEDWIGLSLG